MRTIQRLIVLFTALLAATFVVTPSPHRAQANGVCHFLPYGDGLAISSLDELVCLKNHATFPEYIDTTIYQTADIELDGWNTPIVGWYGTFDGRGFQITDDDSPAPQSPLFYNPVAPIQIRNVHRSGSVGSSDIGTGAFVGYSEFRVTISGSSMDGPVVGDGGYVGGFVGVALSGPTAGVIITGSSMNGAVSSGSAVGGFVGTTEGPVTISNSSRSGNTSGSTGVGGFVGAAQPGPSLPGAVTITDSYSEGDVTSTGTSGVFGAGGFVGSAQDVTITTSYTTSNVTTEGNGLLATLGGFVGLTSTITVSQSFTTGTVRENSSSSGVIKYVGGFVGSANTSVSMFDSFATGDVIGTDGIFGGLIGILNGTGSTITRTYTTGEVTSLSPQLYEFIGDNWGGPSTVTVTNSFCLDEATNCGLIDHDVAKTAAELQSTDFLKDRGWDFRRVWCIRDSVNDGFPVLRAIDFGPGDTGCPVMRTSSTKQTATLDPAGGVCGDHSSSWTQSFRGTLTLPTASDCQRDGHVFLGWTRDPARTAPADLVTSSISRSATLTAVWGALPAAPTRVDVISNFQCPRNCTSAIVVWPASTKATDTATITLNGAPATCNNSGEAFGLKWCWIIGLAPKTTHATTVTWRNQYGDGPATTATFTLN